MTRQHFASRLPSGWEWGGYAAGFTQGGIGVDARTVNVRIVHKETGDVGVLRMWRKAAERIAAQDDSKYCPKCGHPTSEPHCGFGESWQ
jgi:NADH pyrophosphatase NudC (nudix superfamily)